jgi:hypothetical protein
VDAAELRPLSLGELLDRTFTLYRNHFWVFVGIMAIPASLGIPANYLLLHFEGSTLFAQGPTTQPSPALIFAFLGGYFLFMVLATLVYSVAVAAVTHAVSETYLGRKSTVRDSYRSIRGKFWRLMGVVANIMLRVAGIMTLTGMVIGTALIGVGAIISVAGAAGGGASAQAAAAVAIGLLILVLYVAALVAIVYLALRYAVSIPALMLEDLRILAAIRRSVQLTRGRRGQIFVASLLAAIISYVGLIVFQMPFFIPMMIDMTRGQALPNWLALMTAISGAIGSSITGPIFMIVLVLCYYDTRIRKEAFDLQFMMASLNRPAPGVGTVPSA